MPKVHSIIHRVPGMAREDAARRLRAAAESHVSVSKQLAPVSPHGSHGNPPGFMRDSIDIEEVNPLLLKVFVGAFYGIYPEFGTVNQAAQPYFIPGFEAGVSTARSESGDFRGA